MTQAPGAPPPAGGLVADLLGRVLGFIDRPWKAVVIFLGIIVGGFGWLLYAHEDELIEAWLTPDAAALKVADVPEALDRLVEESGADLVQIWAVDLNANSQRFVAARRNDGERPVIPAPRRLPIIVTTSDVKALVAVLAGTPVCIALTGPGSPLVRRLAERGMKRGCAIPIPPSPEAFVGVIYLGWFVAPDQSVEDVAVAAAHEIAGQLATR